MNFHAKSSAVPTFGKASRPYTDAGIDARDLLPVIPPGARISPESNVTGGKTPGQYDPTADNWRGLRGSHFREGLPDKTLRDCPSWPTGNVGIRGAVISAVDSDVRSPDARRLVDRVVVEFQGRDSAGFAVRRRGTGPRMLYAFKPHGTVRSRPGAVKFTLPSDPKDMPKPREVEVKGEGGHWVAAGVHPSGERYEWDPEADLCEMLQDRRLIELGDVDVDRFLETLVEVIEAAGGVVLSRSSKGAGGNGGELRDYGWDEPVMPVDAILDGLDRLPNTLGNFPTHDGERGFVGMLSSIRAALGSEADGHEDDVRRWATAHEDETGADDAYFDRVWGSLSNGVRVDRDSLDRQFRREGIRVSAAHDFPDADSPDDKGVSAEAIKADLKWEADGRNKRRRLLQAVADGWRFKTVNMRTDDTNARVRIAANLEGEEVASHWWDFKTTDAPARAILPEVQKVDGWGRGVSGMWQFLTDLQIAHPDAFYTDECFHPLFDIGEMVPENDAQGNKKYKVNMRPLPEVQKIARRIPIGSGINHPDARVVLDYVSRIFGRDDSTGAESEELSYELDTLAFMLQSGRRPGNMLTLQGDSGTGKSVYSSMLSLIFDGAKAKNLIPGSSLADESAARFAWSPVEGARIVQIQELPATKTKVATALLDSKIKTIVDASEAGDFISIEAKGKDARMVENHARLVITTNFEGTVDIGEQDRRNFYMVNRITKENRPDIGWWRDVLEPITQTPGRIAHFVRYLMDREIGSYNPNAAPPISDGKAQQQRMGITEPAKRFMHDAVRAFTLAGRSVVELREILDLMAVASRNEYENLDHKTDEPQEFTTGIKGNVTAGVLKILQKAFSQLDPKKMRTEKKRWTVYVRDASPDANMLREAHRDDVLDALDLDRRDHPLRPEFLPKAARGPVTPPPIGGEFDD